MALILDPFAFGREPSPAKTQPFVLAPAPAGEKD